MREENEIGEKINLEDLPQFHPQRKLENVRVLCKGTEKNNKTHFQKSMFRV